MPDSGGDSRKNTAEEYFFFDSGALSVSKLETEYDDEEHEGPFGNYDDEPNYELSDNEQDYNDCNYNCEPTLQTDPCVPNPCHVGFTCLVESGVPYCLGPQETTSPTTNPPKTTQSPREKRTACLKKCCPLVQCMMNVYPDDCLCCDEETTCRNDEGKDCMKCVPDSNTKPEVRTRKETTTPKPGKEEILEILGKFITEAFSECPHSDKKCS